MQKVSFKLIFRSWWRNKTFAVISILSLAVGIACTNLLTALVIHEYNVEAGNPMKDRMVALGWEIPGSDGMIGLYFVMEAAQQEILTSIPELEAKTNINKLDNVGYCQVGENTFKDFKAVEADSLIFRFFPHQVIAGSLEEAINSPEKVIVTESFARRLFGREDPLGQMISVQYMTYNSMTDKTGQQNYTIAAVVRDRHQGAFDYDLLLIGDSQMGVNFYSLKEGVTMDDLKAKTEGFSMPSPWGGDVKYFFYSIDDICLHDVLPADAINVLQKRNTRLLQIALFSALLILIIACFNYINLSFSRVFTQLRTINVQKLMGAANRTLSLQLFADTFMMVGVGFLISLLIQHDLLGLVGRIMSVQLPPSFLYSNQVFPLTLCFALVLALIPALYMSWKLPGMSAAAFNHFYTGRKKQRLISVLAILQFSISIGLIMGTFTVRHQLNFLYKQVADYRDIYVFSMKDNITSMLHLKDRVASLPGVEGITLSKGTLLLTLYEPLGDNEGETNLISIADGGEDLLDVTGFQQIQGIPWREAIEQYPNATLVNATYARRLFPDGNYPTGEPLKTFDSRLKDSELGNLIFVGVVEDYLQETLDQKYPEAVIHYTRDEGPFLQVRIPPEHFVETTAQIYQEWEKIRPGEYLYQENVREGVLNKNRRIVELSELLMMYSLISIFLTCFGLFGMSLYVMKQRTKEIGVRKVNGATTIEVVGLLIRRFILWIAFAFVIAVPITWNLLDRWLSSFVYREKLTFTLCLMAGGTVLFIALLTISWHSYKAARQNPVYSLRND